MPRISTEIQSEGFATPSDLVYQIRTGTQFSQKYRLGERIGGGGMAEVYRSTLIGAEGFSRAVAVKRILGSFSADPIFAEMFVNEANIASHLNHPNIVSVLDFDRDDSGQLFLVMELVEGCDLKHLTDRGRLPIPIVAFVMTEVLRALAFAHPLGIVHRDVSPHNVLVSWDGAVKLSDFGIAKAAEATSVTQSGLIKGKIGYMSPEQVEGARLDGRSDLFAAGILMHEMLAGQRLFGGAPDRVVLNRILIAPIAPPGKSIPEVPRSLDDICMKLLSRELDRRYQRAEDAIEDLLSTELISPRTQLDLARIMKQRLVDSPRELVTALTEPVPTQPILEPTRTNTLSPPPRKSWPIALSLVACIAAILILRFAQDDPETVTAPMPVQHLAPPPPPARADTKVQITSNPVGAAVHLDGRSEPAGTTPYELSLAPGEIKPIELRLEGHRPASHVIRGEDLHVEMKRSGARPSGAVERLDQLKKRKKKARDGILPPEKQIGDGILRPNL